MAVIRQRTQVLNQPVGVVRADAGAENIGLAISRAAGTMSQLAFREAAADAEKKGIELAQALSDKKLRTLNPETGKPEAYTAPETFGRIAAEAYQRVIDKRYEDSMNNELRLKAQEIAIKYPFDSETYDQVMSDYIGSMAKNATGKYKAYIEGTGAKYLALTKLNIQERAAIRARENAAKSIALGVDAGADTAYSIALAGGFIPREGEEQSEASLILDREVTNTINGINSGLIKSGSDVAAREQILTSIALGGIEHLMSRTYSSFERNAIELAIRDPQRMGAVPPDLKDDVKELLKYIDPSNKERVLSHSATVAADYNAVEADMTEIFKDQLAEKSRVSELQFSDSLLDFGTQATGLAVSSFADGNPMAVGAAISQLNTMYNSIESAERARFTADESYTRAELESNLKDARQEALRPLLVQAALQDNVDQLIVALNTRSPEAMANLTAQQRQFITDIYKSDIFNPREDIGFARQELSASKDQLKIDQDRYNLRFEISQTVTEAGVLAETGGLSDEVFNNIVNNIKKNIGPRGLTSDQAESEINRLTKQRAFGLVESFARFGTSRDLNNLATYVDSGGQRTEGMTESVIAAGNSILERTQPEQRDAVVGKIRGLKTTIESEEKELEEAIKLRDNQKRILGGNGNPNSKEDRKYSDDIINNKGIDISRYDEFDNSLKQSVIRLFRSAPAQENFIEPLSLLASGLPILRADGTDASDTYLNIFSILASDPAGSRLGNSLGNDTVELLKDANSIRVTIGGNASEIITTLVNRRNDPKSKVQMDRELRGKTPQEYVTDYFNDDIIGVELSDAVEYLLLSGKSIKQVDARLDTLLNEHYPKSRHIVDPRFPAGSIKRSRYALERQFPDEDERKAFIASVESQLPSGYGLVPNLDAGEKKVYLAPDESTAGLLYFAYFVDENEELRQLIFEKDGVPFFPTFSKKDISDFYKKREAENKAELDRLEQRQAEGFKLQQKIRDIDPSISAFTRGLGAGGL